MNTKFYSNRILLLIALIFLGHRFAHAQTNDDCDTSSRYLYWTGEANNDFFNENNWRIAHEHPAGTGTGKITCFPGSPLLYQICPGKQDKIKDKHPKNNSLNPGQPIGFNLYIQSASVVANGDVVMACAQKGITLIKSVLDVKLGTVQQGVVSMLEESTVHLRQGKMSAKLSLNFMDELSWVYFYQDDSKSIREKLSNIFLRDVIGNIDTDYRINQYYQQGSVVRPIIKLTAAAKIFSEANKQGSSADVQEDIIYKGSAIPGGLNDHVSSFILKRGYMATVAVNANGTGKSRVYIASEQDMNVETLDAALQGNVSFIRVVPWNWVAKKGTGGLYDQMNASWFYNWNNNSVSQANHEYVPMAWGASGAFPAAINSMIAKKNTTHVLGFNESDNCSDQSGQYNNLCTPAVAVAYYENLMSIGVRLGTPAPRENGPSGWLKDFMQIAKQKDVRFDFVAVHWYDWGSNPASTPNASAQQIFNRFKSYLQSVYNIYHLPIWITEFNANPNRPNATQEAFLQLAIPYLESLDYVERYAYFQPNGGNGDYYDAGGNLTNIGQLYNNAVTTRSMPNATYVCANDLDNMDAPFVAPALHTNVFEAECGKYLGNQWNVSSDSSASNIAYIRGDNTQVGNTSLAKQVHYEFETAESGSYRVYLRASSVGTGSLKFGIDGKALEQISPFTAGDFTWFQVPRYYDLNVGLHRLTIEYPNTNILVDQIVVTNGQEDLDALVKDSSACVADNVRFGMEATNVTSFFEAENATHGVNWNVKTTANAVGTAYLKANENVMSAQSPSSDENVITFSVNVDKADEYQLWTKIQALNADNNSLWISVDNDVYRKWDHLGNTSYEWYWKQFHYSYDSEDRAFSYFLSPGMHTVKIAIASGNVQIDRLALVTKGKLPAAIDPDVLLVKESLEFEAETATLIGTVSVVACANSSNGQQVTLSNTGTNIVRFDKITANAAGAYQLNISYMSAVARSFRVTVNGVLLNKQTAPSSGDWCYNNGRPGIYTVIVNLNRGLNTIDISPVAGSDAPFMDKINLTRAPLTNVSLEAELAEYIGASATVACTTSSNGAIVNPLASASNGIRYNNLLSEDAKTYNVDVYYISKVARNLKISVNGQPFVTYSFGATGNWCYEGGAPKLKTIQLSLTKGINTIEMRATGTDAPFLDKIVIRELTAGARIAGDAPATSRSQVTEKEMIQNIEKEIQIYPNPAIAGTAITVDLGALNLLSKNTTVQITDMYGRTVFRKATVQKFNRVITTERGFGKGVYFISIIQDGKTTIKKLVIQ